MRKASRLAAILILAGLPWTTGVEEVRSQGAPLPAAIATLRIEAGDGEYLAWADNRLAGPIEVILRPGAGGHVPSDPLLPARASVAAGGSALIARPSTTDVPMVSTMVVVVEGSTSVGVSPRSGSMIPAMLGSEISDASAV